MENSIESDPPGTCPVCGLNSRMGVKGDSKIRHDPCEQKTGHEDLAFTPLVVRIIAI